ncbi:hypothetical protein BABINDRAFT_166751 [Babjeviella inositovora NRRL Y-12698]|uniref:protein-serine/threonine phosphatase n=1 Tax=Babjeviella inositovora NRRL Y-12698 TaxID=984486 RepID=A0A1E3QRU5_9ASCO|nr:uncharacterized protein BABINDRAFT_166751 [Babjeviella inositovora NRRL Y-12698]ODQ80419.1 hypothetical protein BABINDRAFT_166751 [Babjeviella inositovora NRRL Y-12698]
MGQFASHSVDEKSLETKHTSASLTTSIGSMQGYRVTMEDAHCLAHDASIHPDFEISIFGVFDGHGGKKSAKYVSEVLPCLLMKRLLARFHNLLEGTSGDLLERLGKIEAQIDYLKFLRDCFFKVDSALLEQNFNSGSTAVVALLVNRRLVVANVGDSRCYVSVNGIAKSLSYDHKPNNVGELMRIHRSGGFVAMNRVNGVLALSRAFGDFGFKAGLMSVPGPNGKRHAVVRIPPEETPVTCEPEVIVHTLGRLDEFLVLACDGIWDCYKNQTLNNEIRDWILKGKSLQEICQIVLDNSLGMANNVTGIGYDNMTIMLVALHQREGSVEAWYDEMIEKLSKRRGLI